MKNPLLLGVMSAGLLLPSIHAQKWSPDRAMIQKLESGIQPTDFPKRGYVGKPPVLTEYARYYAGYRKNSHRLIAGEFVLHEDAGDKAAGVYVVASQKDFPQIADGSCSVIHVLYDLDTSRITSLTCNGRA